MAFAWKNIMCTVSPWQHLLPLCLQHVLLMTQHTHTHTLCDVLLSTEAAADGWRHLVWSGWRKWREFQVNILHSKRCFGAEAQGCEMFVDPQCGCYWKPVQNWFHPLESDQINQWLQMNDCLMKQKKLCWNFFPLVGKKGFGCELFFCYFMRKSTIWIFSSKGKNKWVSSVLYRCTIHYKSTIHFFYY